MWVSSLRSFYFLLKINVNYKSSEKIFSFFYTEKEGRKIIFKVTKCNADRVSVGSFGDRCKGRLAEKRDWLIFFVSLVFFF